MREHVTGFLSAGSAFCLALAAVLCAGKAAAQSDEEILGRAGEPKPAVVDARPRPDEFLFPAIPVPGDPEDWTAQAREQNGGNYAQPPTKFRPGSVQKAPRDLPVERLDGGHWRVQLSQGDRILSPAVAAGRTFTGSGFGGREFHCLDAATGQALWSVSLSDNGASAVVSDRDVVVVCTESCTMYTLDPRTGRQLWSVWLGDPLLAAPAVAADTVVTVYPAPARAPSLPVPQRSSRRKAPPRPPVKPRPSSFVLAAFDLKTGEPRWQKWIDQNLISAPVIAGGEVYATTVAGTLYKFRLSDGAILLARRCRATSAPAVAGDGVYLTRRADDDKSSVPAECIARLDRRDGQPVYSVEKCDAVYLAFPRGLPEGADWRSADELGTIPDELRRGADQWLKSSGRATALGQLDANVLQQFSGSRLLAWEGNLFNCMGGRLLCVDAATGKRRWEVALAGLGHDPCRAAAAPPVLAGGSLFVATYSGRIHRLDPASGKLLGTTQAGAPVTSEPIVEGGRIYVGTARGQLVCVNTGDPSLTGWNQWGGSAAHTGPPPMPAEAEGK